MKTVEEYRQEKDDLFQVERYKAEYPVYYSFINDFQKKFYKEDHKTVTMGADYGFYYFLTQHILHKKPKHIVEYGPGFTTVLMHRLSQDLDYDLKVTSYEDTPLWFDRLNDMKCNPFGTMKLVDLKLEKETDNFYYCYYDHSLEDHRDVDFVIIDGPGKVIINDISKTNININLDMMEKSFDREIEHMIDGRHDTNLFYNINYKQRLCEQ